MLAVVPEIFAHGATGEGGDILHRRRIGGAGGDHRGVLHGAVFAQVLDHQGNRGFLLADGHIDAVNVGVLLGDDGIDAQRGLADLAVTDDQLALAAAHRGHGIDRLGAGVARFVNALPGDDAGGDHLHLAEFLGCDRPLAVDGLADAIHHAAFHLGTNRHLGDSAGPLDDVAFLDEANIAEDGATNVVFLEVEGQPEDVAREFEQFHGLAVFNTIHTGNTIAHGENGSSFLQVDIFLVTSDLILDDLADFFCFDLH